MNRVTIAICAIIVSSGVLAAQPFSLTVRQERIGGKLYLNVVAMRNNIANTNKFRSWQIKLQLHHDAAHSCGIDTTAVPLDASSGWRDLGTNYNPPTITFDFGTSTYPKWISAVMHGPPTAYSDCIPWETAGGGTTATGNTKVDNEVRVARIELNIADSTLVSAVEWFEIPEQTAAFTMSASNMSVGNTRAMSTVFKFPAPEPNTLLPVELVLFAGHYTDGKVRLDWRTVAETNNCGFDVLRATAAPENADDASQWLKVGFVQGAGTSLETHEYGFTDALPPRSGNVFYRLLQKDNDGKQTMSPIVKVMTGNTGRFELLPNYPNPFKTSTWISFSLPTEGNVIVKVFNDSGVEVAELLNANREAGCHSLHFVRDGLPAGIYRYTVSAGESVQSGKMVLLP